MKGIELHKLFRFAILVKIGFVVFRVPAIVKT